MCWRRRERKKRENRLLKVYQRENGKKKGRQEMERKKERSEGRVRGPPKKIMEGKTRKSCRCKELTEKEGK